MTLAAKLSDTGELDGFLRPASVSLVGRFDRADGPLPKLARYLRMHGFTGALNVITSRVDPELASKVTARVSAMGAGPAAELAVVAVRAELVVETVVELATCGHRRAVIFSSGFSESGNDALESELLETARKLGIRLVGPNCQGLWNRNEAFAATFSEYMEVAPRGDLGRVAVVSQSGAVAYCLAGMLDQIGLSTGLVATTGNEVDVDWAEFVAVAARQAGIDTVLAYLEEVRSLDQLRRAASAVEAAGARLALLKGGRTALGTQAAASHTAAIASDGLILAHLCSQLGITLATDLNDLVAVAAAPRLPPDSHRRRVGIVTTSGGAGVIATDLLSDAGALVPALTERTRDLLSQALPRTAALCNPVDVTATSATDPSLIPAAWAHLVDSGEVDATVIAITMVTGKRLAETIDRLVAEVSRRPEAGKPMVVLLAPPALHGDAAQRLRKASIGTFDSLATVAAALGTPRLGSPMPADPTGPGSGRANGVPARPGTVVSDVALLADFAELGLPVVARTEVEPANVAAARNVLPPYVLKLITDDVHKLAAGNVDIGPVLPDDLESAARNLIGDRFEQPPRVQVQQYLHGALEVFVGLHRDKTFGPILALGLGGRLAEPLRMVQYWPLPVRSADVRAALAESLLGRLLDGLAPSTPDDPGALGRVVEIIDVVTKYFLSNADLAELDVNPVLFDVAGRPSIVDATGIAANPGRSTQ